MFVAFLQAQYIQKVNATSNLVWPASGGLVSDLSDNSNGLDSCAARVQSSGTLPGTAGAPGGQASLKIYPSPATLPARRGRAQRGQPL